MMTSPPLPDNAIIQRSMQRCKPNALLRAEKLLDIESALLLQSTQAIDYIQAAVLNI
jgi:hypothetical protein